MNPQLYKFIFRLFGITLLAACAPQSIPNTSTSPPATAAPTMPTLAPTATVDSSIDVLPTFPFGNPVTTTPFNPVTAAPIISVESPFEFVATLDDIVPGSESPYFLPASDGSVWIIINRSIARLSDSGWTVYLSNYEGYFVGIDSLGRAWFINQNLDSITPLLEVVPPTLPWIPSLPGTARSGRNIQIRMAGQASI